MNLVYKQIGNAVPVRLALAVAEPITEFVKKQLEEDKMYSEIKYLMDKKRMMA